MLLDYDQTWDKLLPTMTYFLNAGFHSALGDSPFWLMFGRDPHMPSDTLRTPEPHETPSRSNRAKNMAIALELARSSISSTQEKRKSHLSTSKKNTISIGDLVYACNISVAKKDYKLLSKYIGPFRVVNMKGNTCVIKNLRTGRLRQVSLRFVKLVHFSSITATENKNRNEVFPTNKKASEVPDDYNWYEVKRSIDLLTDNELLQRKVSDEDTPNSISKTGLDLTGSSDAKKSNSKNSYPIAVPDDVRMDISTGEKTGEGVTANVRRHQKLESNTTQNQNTNNVAQRTRSKMPILATRIINHWKKTPFDD